MNSLKAILIFSIFPLNSYSQTFRAGFDLREFSPGGGYGHGSAHHSNVSSKLHNDESAFLIGYLTMFKATKDKRYLDQFIIHAKRGARNKR